MVKIADEIEKYNNGEIDSDRLLDCLMYDCDIIREEIVSQLRWEVVYEYVCKDSDNRYWMFSRGVGATELQENSPFDTSDLREVQPVTEMVEVTKYIPIFKGGK